MNTMLTIVKPFRMHVTMSHLEDIYLCVNLLIKSDDIRARQSYNETISFSLLAWTLSDGSYPLIAKDEGMGLMISSFTSRELRFSHTIPSDILERVNN